MQFTTLDLRVDAQGIAWLTINRPQMHNAMNADVISDLAMATDEFYANDNIRAVVLTGAGDKSFCAGGDLNWMQQTMRLSRDERIRESGKLATLFARLDRLPKPLIGRINGQAFGGGVGLIAVCDIAIGVDNALFGLTEVRLGLLPANIAPYVVARIGRNNARRVLLNCHFFQGAEAVQLGLLHKSVGADELDNAVAAEIKKLMHCSPVGVAATKKLIDYVDSHGLEENMQYTAQALADAWETADAREGIACFLNKTKPSWAGERTND